MADERAMPWPELKRSMVAILRGVRPDEIEAVAAALIEAGFEAIEVPLNSPEPFVSIEKAVKLAPAHCLIGAGTTIEGSITFSGGLRVDGRVRGDVIAADG